MQTSRAGLNRNVRGAPEYCACAGAGSAAARQASDRQLAMIALIWGAIEFDLRAEFERSRATSIQSTDNLAHLFEDNIVRTIKANDRVLKSLQLSSVNGTLMPDFRRWAREIDGAGDFTSVVSLVDVDGNLVTTSYGPVTEINVTDRDYFQTHRNNPETGLLIGKPVGQDIRRTGHPKMILHRRTATAAKRAANGGTRRGRFGKSRSHG